jgi:hypothetical protein
LAHVRNYFLNSCSLPLDIGDTIPPVPSELAVQVPDPLAEDHSKGEVSPSPRKTEAANIFNGPDPASQMLGLPKSYPQLGRWVALAILTGAIAAFALVGILAR